MRRQKCGVDGAGGYAGDDTKLNVGVSTRKPAKEPHLVRRACAATVENDSQIVVAWLGGRDRLPSLDPVLRDVLQWLSRMADPVRKLSRTRTTPDLAERGLRRRRVESASVVLRRGVVARIVTGPHDTHRRDPHLPMRYDTGRPRAAIRLRISQPRTTSLPCPAGLRARRPSPMIDL